MYVCVVITSVGVQSVCCMCVFCVNIKECMEGASECEWEVLH